MGPVDSLHELAIALETFFKGLSECGLVAAYSVQLQVAAVDFVLQIKYRFLLHEFMKTLQTLLIKTNIPGHESYRDIGIQTPSDFNSVFIEVKQSSASKTVSSDHIDSLVEACVFSRVESVVHWTKENSERENIVQSATTVAQSNSSAPTDIIVTCHPAALAVITEQNLIESAENPADSNKNLDLPYSCVRNFSSDTIDCQEDLVLETSENDFPVGENPNNNKHHFIELDCNEHSGNSSGEKSHVEMKGLEPDMNSLVLKSCDEQTTTSEHLSVFQIMVPSNSREGKPSASKFDKDKKKLFKCKDCDKCFSSTQSLEIHITRKHAVKEQCDMCPKTFSSIQSLQEHCRIEHGGMGCFNCLLCSRRFMTKLSYKRHMDTHVGKKEAVCDMCGKTFSRADYLNKHYMTHSGTRPLKCSQCPRKFISSSHLKNHEKTHTGEREHFCKLCPKSFSRADKLKEHTLRHLKIKRFQCSVCKRTYAEKRDLTKHMKAHDNSS